MFEATPDLPYGATCELPDTILCNMERDTYRDTTGEFDDRRRIPRTQASAQIRILRSAGGGEVNDAEIVEFSAAGLRLLTTELLAIGEAVYIEVDTGTRHDSLVARPVWQNDREVGCEFDVELGLSCCSDLRHALGNAAIEA